VHDGSIFQEPWWWDAIVPGQWDEVRITRGRHTVAGLRYLRRQGRFGLVRLSEPPMTRWSGPWVLDTDAKTATRLAREKKLISELVDALPRCDHFVQSLHPEVDYWLPFQWAGFHIEPRATYRLAPVASEEALWLGFDERIRRAIRKARKGLTIVEESAASRLIDSARATYTRQQRRLPVAEDRVEALVHEAAARGAGRVLAAVDANGATHAALFLAWDHARMYYVLGGGDPDLRMSGAASLLLHHALGLASSRALEFDFAGSVIESIERFFRGFGARPVTYVRVSRSTRRFRAIRTLQRLARRS
jgi:hypothetical protein